jgi:hypothetical protein
VPAGIRSVVVKVPSAAIEAVGRYALAAHPDAEGAVPTGQDPSAPTFT